MQSTLSPTFSVRRSHERRNTPSGQWLPVGSHSPRPRSRSLARYTDELGRPRELVSLQALAGSVLLIDRDAATQGDGRLLARLSPDEPVENCSLVCEQYLREPNDGRRRCRALTYADLSSASREELESSTGSEIPKEPVIDPDGGSCALERVPSRLPIPHLRWCRQAAGQVGGLLEPVSLREVIARLESYEPVCALTRRALARHAEDPALSTAVLQAELVRVQESPIVLNRGLRESVLAMVERERLSMSEIALRCGRIKRDRKGNESGETSWLARRLGLLPDAATGTSTPWIHSDVLGLIARQGLGLSPREVEL